MREIAGVVENGFYVVQCDLGQGLSDRVDDLPKRTWPRGTDELFGLGKDVFNGVQVWRVGRQVDGSCAYRFNCLHSLD